jgi:hypothetical protein
MPQEQSKPRGSSRQYERPNEIRENNPLPWPKLLPVPDSYRPTPERARTPDRAPEQERKPWWQTEEGRRSEKTRLERQSESYERRIKEESKKVMVVPNVTKAK